jgi:hypothetical protein
MPFAQLMLLLVFLGFFFGQFYQVGKDFASLEDYFGLN